MHHDRQHDLPVSDLLGERDQDVEIRSPESAHQDSTERLLRVRHAQAQAVASEASEKGWREYRTLAEAALVDDIAKRLRDHQAPDPGKLYHITITEPRKASAGLSTSNRKKLTTKTATVDGRLRLGTVKAYRHLNSLLYTKKELKAGDGLHLFMSVDDSVISPGFERGRAQGRHIHAVLSVPGRHLERFERMISQGNVQAIFASKIEGVEADIEAIGTTPDELETVVDYALKYVRTLKEAESDIHHPWQYHPK